MKKISIFCDLCEVEENKEINRHWTQSFSTDVKLSFSGAPTVQTCYEYQHLCPGCTQVLVDKVNEAIKTLRTKTVLFGAPK